MKKMIKRTFAGVLTVTLLGTNCYIQQPGVWTEREVLAADTYQDDGLSIDLHDVGDVSADGKWTVVWEDEFDKGSLNTDVWTIEDDLNGIWNEELQYYDKSGDNLSFIDDTEDEGDDILVITAKKETVTHQQRDPITGNFLYDSKGKPIMTTSDYTSARINTMDKMLFNPGEDEITDGTPNVNCSKIEARMKLPAFWGAWPAFWMMGGQAVYPDNGEIDIVETINKENIVYGTAHWSRGENGDTDSSGGKIENIDVTDWHTYSVVWNDTKVEWYVDDILFYAIDVNSEKEMEELFSPQYVILNLAIGGRMTETDWIDPEGFANGGAQMLVDYVKAYSRTDTETYENPAVIKQDIIQLEGGSWNTSIGNWGHSVGNITSTSFPEEGFVADIKDIGEDLWCIQSWLENIEVVPGTGYTFDSTIVLEEDLVNNPNNDPRNITVIIQNGSNTSQVFYERTFELEPGTEINIEEEIFIPTGFDGEVKLVYAMGGTTNTQTNDAKFVVKDVHLYTLGTKDVDVELKDVVESYPENDKGAWIPNVGTWAEASGEITSTNKAEDGFVADLDSIGNVYYAAQSRLENINYEPGEGYLFSSTIVSDIDKNILVQFERTGGEYVYIYEEYISLKANEPYELNKEIYIPSDFTGGIDIVYLFGGNTNGETLPVTSEMRLEVTDVSLKAVSKTDSRLVYYSEVGVDTEINVPQEVFDELSKKTAYVPLKGSDMLQEVNVVLKDISVGAKADSTGTFNSRQNNNTTYDFKSQQVGDDEYVIGLTYTYERDEYATATLAAEKVDIVVYNYDVPDKIYVLDYGLPVELANEKNSENNLYDSIGTATIAARDIENGYGVTTKKLGVAPSRTNAVTYRISDYNFTQSFEQSQGSVVSTFAADGSVDNGSVVYTPNRFMSDVDTFYYGMQVQRQGYSAATNATNGTPVLTGEVKVMPANIVYYEDNFGTSGNGNTDATTGIIYSGKVESVDNNGNVIAESGPIGTQGNSLKMEYGHDDTYIQGNDQFSNGTAHKLANRETAVFKFTGTGFDIMSRANTATGIIGVTVYEDTTGSAIVNNNGNLQVTGAKQLGSMIINTFYSNGDIYQIPMISWKNDGEKGNYIVKITSFATSESSPVIYIDGVRIYNPVKGNQVAENQYELNGEKDTIIKEIRQMILGTDTIVDDNLANVVFGTNQEASLVKFVTDQVGNDVIFMAGKTVVEAFEYGATQENITNPDAVEGLYSYIVNGPNNELYVSDGYGFGFQLSGNVSTLQVGVKKVSDKMGSVQLQYLNGSKQWTTIADITSATEIYYNIKGKDFYKYNDNTCVMLRVVGGTLSFTNMKAKDCEFAPLDPSLFSGIGINHDIVVDNVKVVSGLNYQTGYFKTSDYARITLETSTDVEEINVGTVENANAFDGKMSDIPSQVTKTVVGEGDSARIQWDVKVYIPRGEYYADKIIYVAAYDAKGDYSELVKLNNGGTN